MAPARSWRARLGATPGSAARSRQLLAGAVTAVTVMEALDLRSLDVCPWALREGLLLRRYAELRG